MARKREKKDVTQRNAGPVDLGGLERFPLSRNQSLEYVKGVHRLVFGDDSFFIVLYGAYNVGGLIGTEYNGIGILWENQGKVVLTNHGCEGPRMGDVGDNQRREYARICAMNMVQFRTFINDNPDARHRVLVTNSKAIIKPKLDYKVTDFEATQFATATDKVLFLKALIRFICNHCDRARFTRRVYDGLYQHLGHIAHYNMGGFYDHWFEDLEDQVKFLEHHSSEQVFGDWRDVAEAFKVWIVSLEGAAVLTYYRARLAGRTEKAERQQLATLKVKYEDPPNEEVR